MPALDERMAALEADQKALWKQLDSYRDMLHVLHAMNENLAAQGEVFKSLSQSVRSMDGRIDTLEGAPGSRWSAVTGCTVAALGGLVLGWIARLL